jgi:predicted transposase/invertase (TIGR01784 family)
MNHTESDKTPVPVSGKKRVQLTPEDDPLDITRDPVFKAVLTRETPESRSALRCLVSAAIARPITVISVVANEPPVNDISDRQIRYDISVRFNDGNLGNIEMTVYPDTDEHRRQEYHLARLFTTQHIKGIEHSYGDLRPAYQISLLGENLHQDGALVHRFRYYDPEHNLSFKGLTSIIDIELPKAEQFLVKPVSGMTEIERWAVFFRYIQDFEQRELINDLLDQEEGLAMATAELLTISADDILRARLEHELKNQLDWQSGMVNAKRAGEATGEKRAEEKYAGIIQEKDGKIRALEQKQRQSALNLRGLGLSVEHIAGALTLSPEEVSEYLNER